MPVGILLPLTCDYCFKQFSFVAGVRVESVVLELLDVGVSNPLVSLGVGVLAVLDFLLALDVVPLLLDLRCFLLSESALQSCVGS